LGFDLRRTIGAALLHGTANNGPVVTLPGEADRMRRKHFA